MKIILKILSWAACSFAWIYLSRVIPGRAGWPGCASSSTRRVPEKTPLASRFGSLVGGRRLAARVREKLSFRFAVHVRDDAVETRLTYPNPYP